MKLLDFVAAAGVAALVLLGRCVPVSAQVRSEDAAANAPAPATSGQSELKRAIERAKIYLYSQQHEGNWELTQTREKAQGPMGQGPAGPPPNRPPAGRPGGPPRGGPPDARGAVPESSSQWGGLTSIATYALLAAGENDHDERIAKALAFLKGKDITGTYALALHAQVWNAISFQRQKEYIPSMKKDAAVLMKGLRQSGDAKGFYHYLPDDPGWDASTAQFGVLGMWACEQMGYEVPRKYWSDVEEAWLRKQDRDGSWSYMPGGHGPPEMDGPSISMTAAGVATLLITGDYLHGDAGIDCRGNYQHPQIESGISWIASHYANLATDRHYYYTVFGISRIGLASGRKFIGTHDWFKEGLAQFLPAQHEDGSFNNSVADTAFALLFMARGSQPVMMNKVQYDLTDQNGKASEGPWNQRPRDIANLARWTGTRLERSLKWQIVRLNVQAAALHEAPILYFSGSKPLSLSDPEIDVLRQYVQQGGMILGNADCANASFSKSFEALGSRLFPKYEFRDLPASHVVFTSQQYPSLKWKTKPRLRGQSNGVRELMILIPEVDLSRAWQGRNEKTREEAYQLGDDIYLYSVDRKIPASGETHLVEADPAIQTTSAVTVARLDIGENPDPEPAGWTRLAAILRNQDRIAINIIHAKGDLESLQNANIAHLTGSTRWSLKDEQRATIKKFVDQGGTLIVDSAGGSYEFAEAAEAELQTIFGQGSLKSMDAESPALNAAGKPLGKIQYRDFARRTLLSDAKQVRIRSIEVKGRPAVFFSREDLSAGMVGQDIDGILGYTPDSATRIMASLIRYSIAAKK